MVARDNSKRIRLTKLLSQALGEVIRSETAYTTAEDLDLLVNLCDQSVRLARNIRADMDREGGRKP